ncbi:MAG: ABC transporter substrate-binding protein [Rhodospirillaceae bacterium]|jgi:branched-chain amino acid transport system substrate-binding protein|nr:ABC transporter ATP-binding protein [Rhodospirillaceae bacterium]MDG1274519.1 ABC transporter substrate-binding protein [Alphaproteobacteria bacterium]MBT4355440.1 ABC transporter substrate-binding protein [Rhodospirillaceae bacterium]MBT6305331.1 ABC transporter substrate-binding protein [Rhodospirillaceae bacterium]MBT7731389.1 ABC transporter substrate-binding protein [Rhodospirillaceae bacterium]|tara:strand:+ start:978 stop:2276 length:1299 start_codon:yes stop_codon:yes gene_type:complete
MALSRYLKRLGAGVVLATLIALPVNAKEIKIGVIYDYTGPLAAGGSSLHALGAKIMIDHFNKIGGVEGYKINAIYADAQSKPEIAINEAVRLIEQEKVDMLMGFYSSAQCVPVSAKVDAMKKFMWITTCISPAVLKDRHLEHVFRIQPHGGMFGTTSPDMVAAYAKSKLGVDPKDLKVAIIHEDGPYGSGVAGGNEQGSKKHGFKIVLKEGYAATSPDLSSLVTKLKRKRPDVIFHTGYNPDISLFLRQSRELGLKWKALVGHGAGYGVPDKLYEAVGDDANYIFNVDPVSIWLIDPETLAPGLGKITKMVGVEYKKARPDIKTFSAHVGMAASNVYTFFDDVLPRAIKKYGGISSEALRKAAAETNIPVGGTLMGYGVKFQPKSSDMAGQNNDAFPVVVQYTGGEAKIAWPKELQTTDPVLSLPKSSPYSK